MNLPAVAYRIHASDPAAHRFEVVVEVAVPHPEGQEFSLPVWIPGSYLVREFSKSIVSIAAENSAGPVALHQLDKCTWRADPTEGPLRVTMTVMAWDLSVRTAHLDTTHGFFNGTSVFLHVHGRENERCTVDIGPPNDARCSDWRLATSMRRLEGEEWGFGQFECDDYDELIDHPVEMGTFDVVAFEACGVPHAMAITGRHQCDMARLARDLQQICESQIQMFGLPAPIDRYLFLTTVVGDGYGGLEHRWSTALLCKRDALPTAGMKEVSEDYRGFLGLCSHEYFHLWNVKRIKPAAFTPYDLSRENYTTLLWAFEGITSYFDDLTLLRSERISETSYLQLLARNATRVYRSLGRLVQPVGESSFDAWTKFYRQDATSPNMLISYYSKGALIALCLDLTLRRDTDGRVSLDDVMRAMWERHGRTGVGVPEDGVERLVAEVSGLDLTAFFDQAIRGTEDLPLESLLASFGIKTTFRVATSWTDKGGSRGDSAAADWADLGARVVTAKLGAKLASVRDGGAARLAGLAEGDVIAAWNGIRATRDSVARALKVATAGDSVRLHVFRRDELIETVVTLQQRAENTVHFTVDEDATLDANERRLAWLSA